MFHSHSTNKKLAEMGFTASRAFTQRHEKYLLWVDKIKFKTYSVNETIFSKLSSRRVSDVNKFIISLFDLLAVSVSVIWNDKRFLMYYLFGLRFQYLKYYKEHEFYRSYSWTFTHCINTPFKYLINKYKFSFSDYKTRNQQKEVCVCVLFSTVDPNFEQPNGGKEVTISDNLLYPMDLNFSNVMNLVCLWGEMFAMSDQLWLY